MLSDYAKGTLSRAAELIALCRAAHVPVLVDPKGTHFERYRGAFALTPNRGEFEAVVGPCATEAELLSKGNKLRTDLELDALLVTRGEQGMTLFTEGEPYTLPTHAREVFDVTGAGDTVIALLAAGFAAGLDPRDAAGLANLGAGIVVGKIGVATASRSELQHALHMQGSGGRGLVELPELLGARRRSEGARRARRDDERLLRYLARGPRELPRRGQSVRRPADRRRQRRRIGEPVERTVASDQPARRSNGRARGSRGGRLGRTVLAKTRRRS